MRIISGLLKGRQFNSPSGHKTHPMSEKMRGAIFNMLGDISGMSVLDAYSGSGAIGFEAKSRGADSVTMVDSDKNAFSAISASAKVLGVEVKASQANISSWLDTNTGQQFDIVICDPPYDSIKREQLQKIASRVAKSGIVVLSLPPTMDIDLGENYNQVAKKEYGDSTLVFYRRIV